MTKIFRDDDDGDDILFILCYLAEREMKLLAGFVVLFYAGGSTLDSNRLGFGLIEMLSVDGGNVVSPLRAKGVSHSHCSLTMWLRDQTSFNISYWVELTNCSSS